MESPSWPGDIDGSVDPLLDGELGILVDPENLAEMRNAIVAVLQDRHPHPNLRRPDFLRTSVIDHFSIARFHANLEAQLTRILSIARPPGPEFMCGIAGIISKADARGRLATLLPGLQTELRHRGPDDQGVHVSPDGRAGLVSTRLAILDLTAAGHQPMLTTDGRYAIVFNGEIYNFRALAASLEQKGVVLRSHSDTEVVLALYRLLGVDCVRELRGMFAFAIWDDAEKTCFLARDPLGIKPLYYNVEAGGALAFASELRALRRTGLVGSDLDPVALGAFFRQGSVPEPLTLLRGARSLEAGHWLRWRDGNLESRSYWSLPFGNGDASAPPLGAHEDTAAVRAALIDSLEHHFVSDVPVGLFLSGGIDSTALLALSRSLGHNALSTYSLSFDDAAFDEGELARRTAEHFGSRHTDHRLTGMEAKGLFADFLNRLDQPSVDGFNTFAVSRVAHEHGAKVVLSGLGGDEIFGGYPSFTRVPSLLRLGRFPAPLRRCPRGGPACVARSSARFAPRRISRGRSHGELRDGRHSRNFSAEGRRARWFNISFPARSRRSRWRESPLPAVPVTCATSSARTRSRTTCATSSCGTAT